MRIIAYGCSFTSYCLGTYADILSCDYDVTNKGRSGVGNDYILHTLMQDFKNNILSQYDMVIVQWSGFTRWNYLASSKWLGLDGSIYNPYNVETKTAYNIIKRFYNPVYEKEKFINYMILVNGLLSNHNTIFLSYEKTNLDFIHVDNMFDTYKGDYEFLPTSFSKNNWTDDHPTLMQHLEIAKKMLPISSQAERKVSYLHNKIKTKKIFDNYNLDFTNRNTTAGS